MIEDNKFALSVHTRNVSAEGMPRLDELLETALEEQPLLRRSEGKCVVELRPQVHWHKGRAVEWLLKNMCEQMGLPGNAAERTKLVLPVYIGDDTTDEDAFEELRSRGNGISILVREKPPKRGETAAEFWLRQTEVADFLTLFLHDQIQLAVAGDEDAEEGGVLRETEEEEKKAESDGGGGGISLRGGERPASSSSDRSAVATGEARADAQDIAVPRRGSALGEPAEE